MKTEFRKSFEKDLKNIKDPNLLERVKSVIEEIENAVTVQEINDLKMMISLNKFVHFLQIFPQSYSATNSRFINAKNMINYMRILVSSQIFALKLQRFCW
jgi:hypothetical protein